MEAHFLLLCLFVSGSYANSCYFKCNSGKCIPQSYICDNDNDCPSREDERNCYKKGHMNPGFLPDKNRYWRRRTTTTTTTTTATTTTTTAGPCKEGESLCASGKCIPTAWVCDSHPDCPGGDDENNCTSVQDNSPQDGPVLLALNSSSNASCTSEQFACDEGKCIPNGWVCDSYSDCRSGEDEAECPSTVKPNLPHCDMTLCSACFSTKNVGPLGCPTDFVKFKDTCLWINVFPTPWEIAQKICQSQESKFASIPPNEQLMEFLTFLKQKDLIGLNYWVAGAGDSVDFLERKMETHHEFYEHQMKKEGFVKSVNHIDKCNYLHNSLPEIFRSPECADYAGVICEWINPRKLQ